MNRSASSDQCSGPKVDAHNAALEIYYKLHESGGFDVDGVPFRDMTNRLSLPLRLILPHQLDKEIISLAKYVIDKYNNILTKGSSKNKKEDCKLLFESVLKVTKKKLLGVRWYYYITIQAKKVSNGNLKIYEVCVLAELPGTRFSTGDKEIFFSG